MSHPIVALQKGLVAALSAAPELAGVGVFDAPQKGAAPPWVAIARHDVLPRDGDLTPGFEHRLVLQCWAPDASRKAVLGLVSAALLLLGLWFIVSLLLLPTLDRTTILEWLRAPSGAVTA